MYNNTHKMNDDNHDNINNNNIQNDHIKRILTIRIVLTITIH